MTVSIELETIRLDHPSPGILLATLNRPGRLNAMTRQMFADLIVLGEAVNSDEDERVVVLTGAGRAFCAGGDLSNMVDIESWSSTRMRRHQELGAGAMTALRGIGIPVIAAVNGPATGGGLSLALGADLRYASPAAKFNAAFTRLGFSGGQLGTSWLLPRLIGWGLTSELLLTGRFMDAAEAERTGLVNKVVAAETLLDHVMDIARSIAALPPEAVRSTKADMQLNLETATFAGAMEIETRTQILRGRDQEMHGALDKVRRELGLVGQQDKKASEESA